MADETEELREHINDHEWLYQHGQYGGTLYASWRRLGEAFKPAITALVGALDWLTRRLDSWRMH